MLVQSYFNNMQFNYMLISLCKEYVSLSCAVEGRSLLLCVSQELPAYMFRAAQE